MATTKTTKRKSDPRKAMLDYSVYVPLGAGQLVAEKTRDLLGRAWSVAQSPGKTAVRTYQDLAERGERIAGSIRRSAYTKSAFEQTRNARSQVKAASTSLRKAAGTSATATRQAARKIG